MSSLLRFFTCLSVYAVLAVALLACQTTQPQTNKQTINPPEIVFPLTELNKNPESLDAMFRNISNGQTTIIKIDKDYIFPLIFDLKNKTAEVDLNNNTIELSFKQDMYISLSRNATKLSKDGRNWYDIKNLKALKKLLTYSKGTLTFSISANSGDSVALVMTIATDAD